MSFHELAIGLLCLFYRDQNIPVPDLRGSFRWQMTMKSAFRWVQWIIFQQQLQQQFNFCISRFR